MGPDPSGRTIYGTAVGCQLLSCALLPIAGLRAASFISIPNDRQTKLYKWNGNIQTSLGLSGTPQTILQCSLFRSLAGVAVGVANAHGVESRCLRLNLKQQEEPHGDDAAFGRIIF